MISLSDCMAATTERTSGRLLG